MKVTAYISSTCAWSGGVCEILDKYGIAYEKLDISSSREAFEDMLSKSGQLNTPCVEIDGIMLTDTSGQEVEDFLLSRRLVSNSRTEPDDSTSENAGHRFIAHVRLTEPKQFF